jgi:hypothetical protein
VRIKINNAADADAQYVCFDAPIAAKDTLLLTFGATLGAGDVVTVYSSNADTAFQLFGSEITWWLLFLRVLQVLRTAVVRLVW